jgi:diacylglycerol kinase (ATP)
MVEADYLIEQTEAKAAHPFAPEVTLAIYNPVSGHAGSKLRARRLVALLERRGYRVICPHGALECSRVVSEGVRAGIQAVIIIGGDGTLWEVIALLPLSVRIAYYPGGTSNLFALNWNIPRSPHVWMGLLESGNTRSVRLGLGNERPFASVASVGFDALVVHRTGYPMKQFLSQGAYALQIFPSYLTYSPPKFTLMVDGKPWEEDVLGLIVGRGQHYGGPFHVLPAADPNIPQLTYAILGGKSKWNIGRFAIGMLFETLSQMHGVSCGVAKEITVETSPPSFVQLDGDPCGSTPVTFSVEATDRTILA